MFTQHELLELQEQIRHAAATAQVCEQSAQIVADPDLQAFCQQEAKSCQNNAQKLMNMLLEGRGPH